MLERCCSRGVVGAKVWDEAGRSDEGWRVCFRFESVRVQKRTQTSQGWGWGKQVDRFKISKGIPS